MSVARRAWRAITHAVYKSTTTLSCVRRCAARYCVCGEKKRHQPGEVEEEHSWSFEKKKHTESTSCAGRRMAQVAAHLVEEVIPWVPTRQWVVSVPIPLRYWMAPSRELTATTLTRNAGLTVVLPVMQAGAVLQEHHAPAPVTILPLFGSIVLSTDEGRKSTELDPGTTAAFAAHVEHRSVPFSHDRTCYSHSGHSSQRGWRIRCICQSSRSRPDLSL